MMSLIDLPKYAITIKQQGKGVFIPELKLLFDTESQSDFEPEIILITHLHADQCFSLPSKLIQNSGKTTVYVPNENKKTLTNYVQASYPNSINFEHEFIGAISGETIKLKDNVYCKVYDLKHSVPCRGYGLIMTKTQLKKEYIGINRQEVIQLKRKGIILTEVIQEPTVAYLHHASKDVFEKYSDLLSYSYIILSLDDDKELEESIISSYPNNKFVIVK